MTINPAQMSSITMAVDIDASVDAVWTALTDNIGEWWPAEFFAGGEDGKRRYMLEATPGGRMCEEWDTGGGTLWGNVVSVDPGKMLQVLGCVMPNWGGPTHYFATWELEGDENKTKLTFSESGVGRVSAEGMQEKDVGWKFLWATMKAHLEGTPAPKWGE